MTTTPCHRRPDAEAFPGVPAHHPAPARVALTAAGSATMPDTPGGTIVTCTHTAAARRTREERLTPATDSAGHTHTLTWERTRIEGPDLHFRGVWTTTHRGVEWTVSGEYPPGAYSDDHLVWLLCARTGTRAPGELLSMARGADVHRLGRGADTDPTSLLPGAADQILSADLT